MPVTLLGVLREDRQVRRLAWVLLVANVAMILPAAVSVASGGIEGFDGSRLDLRFDRTLPELIGYGQLAFAVGALFLAGRRDGARLPLAFAAIGTMLLLDDALRVHETVGRTVDTMRDGADVGPLRAQDVGELLTWAVVGLVSLVLLWWGTRGIGSAERDAARPWLWVPGLLVGAAVVDVIGASQGIDVLSLADDALEAVALSVAAVLAWARWRVPMPAPGAPGGPGPTA